ncbi:MAG: sigma-70 family RNA polymerase sigma factor [Candidatus Omnitrophica bacterium]|nr:sigma-70 family RNA polymerase sigma factor [Candidatus Omnitrophota bacterium]MDD5081102.1 sigma-70 family RNA polymerase sigma factor [Candidatus Omnitrophota bacterium]
MSEDITYIDRFLEGDEKGFEMLVMKYHNRALNIVYSLIGRDSESEDIVQEAFCRVYNGLKSFKRSASFATWFYRIVVNMTYDFLRKRRRSVVNDNVIENAVSDTPGPDDLLIIKERERIINKALAAVPLRFRTALVLKDVEGLSYRKIAEVLKCRIGTVESKIYRARQFLRKEVGNVRGFIHE